MSLDMSGADAEVKATGVNISVTADHPLIRLGQALPWMDLMEMVVPDLKKTTANGCWWMGAKLKIRIHLAAYILQKVYNLTDRKTEYGLKDNAAYQIFCGKGIVPGWHAPDHSKIENFSTRLSPETQRTLANETAKIAVALGFADPSKVDIDSTVQEANIAYPADASLMTGLAGLGKKVIDYLREKTRGVLPKGLGVDMKTVKAKARSYFFLAKNTDINKRRACFKELHRMVKKQMRPVVDICRTLDSRRLNRLPWNIRQAVDQINALTWRYLLDVGYFTRTHTIKAGKILSLHAKAIACITKGKVGKERDFGRVFQLGRVDGNFLFVMASNSLQMNDRQSLLPMVEEHAALFGQNKLKSIAADRGYWSQQNLRGLRDFGALEIGLQPPTNVKRTAGLPSKAIQEHLRDRRAGIEALISRTKHGGQLGRSRMKSDTATLAAGYASVLGFNLRQLSRKQRQEKKRAA